ncbi:MAG: hypothetical protein RR296_13225, partial [Clostridia bacterium]
GSACISEATTDFTAPFLGLGIFFGFLSPINQRHLSSLWNKNTPPSQVTFVPFVIFTVDYVYIIPQNSVQKSFFEK